MFIEGLINNIYLNYVSIMLIILTAIIGSLAIDKWEEEYKNLIGILIIILIFSFIVKNIFWFYYIFELLLVPIYLIIYYNGQTDDNLRISYKFIYYALSSSLLWLISLISIYTFSNQDSNRMITMPDISIDISGLELINNNILAIGFLIPLLIKLPMVPLHLWLNDLHTSSPVSGSILLAGVILKVSVYGIITYFIPNFSNNLDDIKYTLVILSVPNTIISSIMTIRQVDYKRLIAYSSVNHMNLLLISLFIFSDVNWFGSIVFCLGHGFISGSLFYHVNTIYERTKTKNMFYLRGLVTIFPLISIMGFILHLSNMALPPSVNWISELIILGNSYSEYMIGTIIISTSMIFGLIYSLWSWFKIYYGDTVFIKKVYIKIGYIRKYIIIISSDCTFIEFILSISFIIYIFLISYIIFQFWWD